MNGAMKTPKWENPKTLWTTTPASLPSTRRRWRPRIPGRCGRRSLPGPVWNRASRETGRPDGSPVSYGIPVSAYPTSSGKLLVNSPGSGELKDGRHDRWDGMARHLQELGIATMVTYNAPRPDFKVQLEWEPYSYEGASWNRLDEKAMNGAYWSRASATWSTGRWSALPSCAGATNPQLDVYWSTFHRERAPELCGGSAVGAVAFNYSEVKRILLLSAYDSVGDWFYEGISRFTGDIYMAFGSQDPMAGFLCQVVGMGQLMASSFEARQVPNCDHRFSGAVNSQALVKAFYWAFDGDDSFPDPSGAPMLYE